MRSRAATPSERLLAVRSRAHMRGAVKDATALASLLAELHMPATLLGGKRIASQACCLLRVNARNASPDDRRELRRYVRELRWILRHAERLALVLFDRDADRRKFLHCRGENPYVIEGAQNHGLCALLWEKYPNSAHQPDDGRPDLRPQFDALRMQATLVHLIALRHWANTEEWSSMEGPGQLVRASMYRRTLAIKHFTMRRYRWTKPYRDALAAIPLKDSRSGYESILRNLRQRLPETSDRVGMQLPKDLAAIRRLLRVAEDPTSLKLYTIDKELDEEVRTPQDSLSDPPSSQQGPDGLPCVVECQTEEDDDEDENLEQQNSDSEDEDGESPGTGGAIPSPGATYTRQRWSEEEIRNCTEAGIHPADVLPLETLHLSSRRSGNGQAAVAMAHQNLSLAWNNLEAEEVCIALQILETLSARGPIHLELLALAKTVLARGWPLNTAESIEVRADRLDEVGRPTLLLLPNESGSTEWQLPAVPIPYHQEHGRYEGCRQTVKSFVTPDYWQLGGLLRRLIAIKFPGWNGEPVHPFAKPIPARKRPPSYEKRLKLFLESAASDRGPGLAGRVTFARLGRMLPQRIYDLTAGNLVLVTYATLRKNPTGEDDRYYATPAVRSVQHAEYTAVSSLNDEFRAMGYDASIDLRLKPSDSSGYLGSPMCPTLEAMEEFLSSLIKTILEKNGILSNRLDREAFIVRHNAFVMLTFCSVTLGTCHRPSHTGVPDLGQIDTATGQVSIQDKGIAKARLGVAADLAIAQLRAWRDYVRSNAIRSYFGELPDLDLFFISGEGKLVPVSLATLQERGLPFVANFARHIVKTIFDEWDEAGDPRVCQEWISALLGHFTVGEEQFGAHSIFCYPDFARSMCAALHELLCEAKFAPIDISGRQITVYEPETQHFLESTAP